MTMKPPVLDADLHAYVDNQGDEALEARVTAFLAGNKEASERIARWSQQNDALRAAFPLPVSSRATFLPDEKISEHTLRTTRLALWINLALAFLIGIALTATVYSLGEILTKH